MWEKLLVYNFDYYASYLCMAVVIKTYNALFFNFFLLIGHAILLKYVFFKYKLQPIYYGFICHKLLQLFKVRVIWKSKQ